MKKMNLLITFISSATPSQLHNFDLQLLIKCICFDDNHECATDQRNWSNDATNKVWNIGSQELQIERELNWKASCRKATIVYAGLITRVNSPWGINQYIERYDVFVKAKYDQIVIITNSGTFPVGGDFDYAWKELRKRNAEIVDEHCKPEWFREILWIIQSCLSCWIYYQS